MTLFVLEDSFCTFFIITLINRVGLVDSILILNQFVENFYDNLFYQLQLRIDILEDLVNIYLDYSLYLLAKILESIKKTL